MSAVCVVRSHASNSPCRARVRAAEPKSLWVVEGARHQDLLAFDRQGYEEHVVGFLMQALGTR
jgi:hypothetical protein